MEDPFQDNPGGYPSKRSASGSDSPTRDLVRDYVEAGSSQSLLNNPRKKKERVTNPAPLPQTLQNHHASGLDGQQSSPNPGGWSNVPHLKRQLSPPTYDGTTLGSGISPERNGMRLPKCRISSESAKPPLPHATPHDGIRHVSSPRPNLGIREFPLGTYRVPLLPFTEADIRTRSQPCEPTIEPEQYLGPQRPTKDGNCLPVIQPVENLEENVQELRSEISRWNEKVSTAQKDSLNPEADHNASGLREVEDCHPKIGQVEAPSSPSAAQKHVAQDEGIQFRDFAPNLRAGNEVNDSNTTDDRKDIFYRAGHRIAKRIFGTKHAKKHNVPFLGKKGFTRIRSPVKKARGKKSMPRASMDGTAGRSASTEFITIAQVDQPRREPRMLECTAYEETHAQLGSPPPMKHQSKRSRLWRRMSALF